MSWLPSPLAGSHVRHWYPATITAIAPSLLMTSSRMCAYYANVEEPAFGREPGLSRLRSVLNHIAYEQFAHQFSAMENVGRTLVLLGDHAARCPTAPTPEDWARALGVPLEQFMRLGFAMHVAALSNGGGIDREVLKMDHVAPMFRPLTPDEALDVIDRWFAANADELRVAGAIEETPGAEKWSLSPLVAKPLVALPDGRYVMPWPRLVLDRITPTGLYFIGLDVFGPAFPDALGTMFQDYVGTQLALLEHADVRPEIVYGRCRERTVDFFIITPEVVLLVEVKAARPVRATRLGTLLGDEDTANKVGYAFTQIERTTQLIRDGHPAVAAIPKDRALRGLVITLEPFHLVNTHFYDDVLQLPPSQPRWRHPTTSKARSPCSVARPTSGYDCLMPYRRAAPGLRPASSRPPKGSRTLRIPS